MGCLGGALCCVRSARGRDLPLDSRGESLSMKRSLTVIASTLFLLSTISANAQQSPMRDFPVDHFARVDSAADARFLLDAPAGKHGFVQSVDGHLTLDGRRFRMW